MTWASTYTHDPASGQRIDQYALPAEAYGPSRNAVQRSGYRHYRSTLQAGLSSDNLHIVEQWGKQVIPYEQWRFPYRPYGVPYDAWGPPTPYGIFNGQIGLPPGIGPFPGVGTHPGYGNVPGHGNVPGNGGQIGGMGRPQTLPGIGYPGNGGWPSRGFPLQPQYQNQPWFDGNYPEAPPLDRRSDQEFFYHPPIGRPTN